MTLIWLALSSIVWGAILVGVGTAFQSLTRASGAERQWLWRGLALLLVLPWLAAPFAALMPRPDFTLPEMLPELPAQNVSVTFTAPMGEASVALPQAALPWPEIVLALIVAGWAWRAFAARRSARILTKIVARSIPARDGLALGLVRTWAQRLSLRRRPDLRLTEPSVSPFSFGAAKPVICLPEDMERNLKPAALDLVVGHECLHVARGDGWLRPIERLVADLMWFNPFAWIMRRQLDLARELACDEAVLDRCAAPSDYARVLRDVASLASGLDANAPAASMSLSGGGRNLILRVRRALRHAKRKPGRAALAGALFLTLAGAPVAIAQALIVHGPDGGIVETSPDTQRPMLALIHAPMDAVVAVSPRSAGVSEGSFVILRATAVDDLHKGCVLGVDGLTDLRVANGATIKEGAPIGVKHPDSREIFGEPPVHTPCGMTAEQGYRWRGAPLPDGASVSERLVASAYDGKVAFLGETPGEGRIVEITHGRDRQRYPHMSDVRVKLGQQVAAGEVIGARKLMTEAEAQEAALKYAVRVYQPDPPAPPAPAQPAAPARAAPPAQAAPPAPPAPEAAPATPATPAAPAAAPAPPAAPALHIVAVRKAHLEVRGADGTKFLDRDLAPDESYSPRVGAGWTVTTPDGSAFEWRLGNRSLGPLAARGRVNAQSIDLAMKREVLPAPPAPPAIPTHAEIRTPFDARVTKVATTKELGLYVVVEQIDSPQGFGGTSAHGCKVEAPHLSKSNVKQGQSVRAGDVIGERSNGDGNITAECKSFNIDQVPGPTTAVSAPGFDPKARLVGADKAVLSPPAHLTSGFGFRTDPISKLSAWHEGVDIGAPLGAAVHAPGPGRIVFAGQKDAYGNVVELQLPDRMLRFGHLNTLAVKEGDIVAAGATLGTVGMSGPSTGAHLHLEMWLNGKSWDPQRAEGLILIGTD